MMEFDKNKDFQVKTMAGAPAEIRSRIIMPDGKERIPLGSGVITGFLGEGGMASVYEIWNWQLEVHHAVKLINPNCSADARERFQTEMKISAKLHHPNIIEIYGVGKWNGLPYIEMEKIDGFTLDKLIKTSGALSPLVCVSIAIMVGRALKYAHNQEYVIYGNNYHGIIHRDLKPSNIIVCKNGIVKLMDFGIATPTDASFHTVEGTVLGTLQYLSPEQLEGRKLDCRTDIYSLGVTLYEALTGALAYPEHNVHKLMGEKIKGRFKPFEEYTIKVPYRLKRLVYRCMHHDARRRIVSADELLREAGRIHNSMTSDAPEIALKKFMEDQAGNKTIVAIRNRIPWQKIIVVLLAAIAVAGLLFLGRYVNATARHRTSDKQAVASSPAAITQDVPDVGTAQTQGTAPAGAGTTGRASGKGAESVESRWKKTAVAAAKPEKQLAFIEQQVNKHGTNDLLTILVNEYRAGAYAAALKIYDHLPAGDAGSTRALLYKMRSLAGLGNKSRLSAFLDGASIDDAEYYIAKARLAYERGSVADARANLDKSISAPRELVDYETLKRDENYYRALCATGDFDRDPNEETYKTAMEAWWRLKSLLRTFPRHEYNAVIVKETQRIGEKYRAEKG